MYTVISYLYLLYNSFFTYCGILAIFVAFLVADSLLALRGGGTLGKVAGWPLHRLCQGTWA
jgi:hypothetical protein